MDRDMKSLGGGMKNQKGAFTTLSGAMKIVMKYKGSGDYYTPSVQVEEKLFADNVAPTRSLEVRNHNMVLRVNSKHTDIIDTRIIDGKKCLVKTNKCSYNDIRAHLRFI